MEHFIPYLEFNKCMEATLLVNRTAGRASSLFRRMSLALLSCWRCYSRFWPCQPGRTRSSLQLMPKYVTSHTT